MIPLSMVQISASNQVLQSEVREATNNLERLFTECGVVEIILKMADGSAGFISPWKGTQ